MKITASKLIRWAVIHAPGGTTTDENEAPTGYDLGDGSGWRRSA